MKTLAKAIAATTLALAGAQTMAADVGKGFNVSMNAGVVSNYIWRGITQSRDNGAIQGGLDVKHSSGAYVGTWMSSADFETSDSEAAAADIYMEQDIYAGYGFSAGDFSFDFRYTDYHYPGAGAADFSEVHGHVSAYGATLGADYSTDMPLTDEDSAFHYYASYTHALPADIGLTATVGEYDYKNRGWIGGSERSDSKYSYYSLGVNKTMIGINWGLTLTDTNVEDDNCAGFNGGKDYCDAAFTVSATKSL